MRKRVLFLTNEVAGTGTSVKKSLPIITSLTLAGCAVTVFPILPEQKLISEDIIHDEFSEEVRSHYDMIACCGGDGTLHHVVESLVHEKLHIPLMYYPAGTTNDFAKSLKIPDTVEKISALVHNGSIFYYDIGRFNRQCFNYIAAFGAFTEVSYSTDQSFKNAFGYAAYVLKGISTVGDSLSCRCHMKVTHDNITEEDDYIFGSVSNSTSVGGFSSGSLLDAHLNDGKFEIMLIRAPKDFNDITKLLQSMLRYANASMHDDADMKSLSHNDFIQFFHASQITFDAENPVKWTLDGEYGGKPKHVAIRNLHKRIGIYVPKEIPASTVRKGVQD